MLDEKDCFDRECLVLIDCSYLIYYSLHGAYNEWFKTSENKIVISENYKDIPYDDLPDLTTCDDYTRIYAEYLLKRIDSINWILKNKIFNQFDTIRTTTFLCQDSPLKTNWRMQYYQEYKAHRKLVKHKFKVKNAFNYAQDVLFPKLNLEEYFKIHTLRVADAEGDDVIASMCKNSKIKNKIIIASDQDFLQLRDDYNARMFNLEGVEVLPEEYKKNPVSAKQYLFAKILMGDDSDNINQVFPRCGYQTAMKYVLDTESLKARLNADAAAKKQFVINNKIINFDNIPTDLQQLVITESEKLLKEEEMPF